MSQPLIIEKNVVVELSRYTSTDKISNAEYTNKLATPITVNENDNILIKQCFIQNKLIDDNSIHIDRDMSVKFQFVYYIIAHGLGQYLVDYLDGTFSITALSDQAINGLPYMLVNQTLTTYPYYNQTFGKPVVEEFTINLKESIYEKATLADLITRQIQSANTKPQNLFIPGNNLTTCGTIVPFYESNPPQPPIFKNFSVPQTPSNPDKIVTTIQKQLYFIDLLSYSTGSDPLPFDGSLFYLDNSNNPVFCKLVPMVDPSQVNYSVVYNNNINVMLVPFMNTNPMGVYSFEFNNQTFTGNVFDCGFIGCNEPTLLFNDNQGNQKFSFQIHSPIIQGGNQSVGIYTSTTSEAVEPFDYPDINDTSISYLSSYSGIMFVNIYENYANNYGQEVELLTLLGFTLTDLIPVDDIPNVFNDITDLIYPDLPPETKNYFQYNNYLKYTTRQFFPLGALETNFPFQAIEIAPPGTNQTEYTISLPSSIFLAVGNNNNQSEGYQFSQSDNSTSLIASSFPIESKTNSGHWLVELSGWLSDYVNEEKLMMVKCLVGNYLYGNSFSQTLGPDSTIYTHHGLPLSLQQVSIRILNPVTKLPPPNYIIGTNSSIYLQIVKHDIVEETTTKK